MVVAVFIVSPFSCVVVSDMPEVYTHYRQSQQPYTHFSESFLQLFLADNPCPDRIGNFRRCPIGHFQRLLAVTHDQPATVKDLRKIEPHCLSVATFEADSNVRFWARHVGFVRQFTGSVSEAHEMGTG